MFKSKDFFAHPHLQTAVTNPKRRRIKGAQDFRIKTFPAPSISPYYFLVTIRIKQAIISKIKKNY